MREGQLAVSSRATAGMLMPEAEDRINLLLDQIEVESNDLADGLLKTRQVAVLPRAKFPCFGFTQVLHLVFGRIVNSMPERLKKRRYLCPPGLAEIR